MSLVPFRHDAIKSHKWLLSSNQIHIWNFYNWMWFSHMVWFFWNLNNLIFWWLKPCKVCNLLFCQKPWLIQMFISRFSNVVSFALLCFWQIIHVCSIGGNNSTKSFERTITILNQGFSSSSPQFVLWNVNAHNAIVSLVPTRYKISSMPPRTPTTY